MADKKSNDAAKEAAKRALEAAAAKKAAPKKKIEHTYTQVGQQSHAGRAACRHEAERFALPHRRDHPLDTRHRL